MALALRISAPLAATYGYSLDQVVIFPRRTRPTRVRFTACQPIRCSNGNPGEAADQSGKPNRAPTTSSRIDIAQREDYAGWTPLENDNKSNNLAGFLQIGASLLLAVGFAVVTYTAYARKGNKHAVIYSVTTQQEQQTELPSRESKDDTVGVHKAPEFATSSPPSSNESIQEAQGEKPQPVVDSESDLHQKKTSPGQDSFPSEEGTVVNAEEDVLSTQPVPVTDLESEKFVGAELDSKSASSVVEETQPTDDGQKAAAPVRKVDGLTDDVSSDVPSAVGSSASNLAETSSTDKPLVDESAVASPAEANLSSDVSDGHLSSSESAAVKKKVNDKENEEPGASSTEGDAGINVTSDESDSTIKSAEVEASPESKEGADFAGSKEDAVLTISASLVVPNEVTEDVLEILGLEMSPKQDGSDLTAAEPGHVNRNPSVIEILSSSLGSEYSHSQSVGIPAPSTPSAAAQATPGSILVPATVDHEQEQALAALQALKVIEQGVEVGGLCTRREYARWLIASTSTLARSPTHKVFPAMYIENSTELAFNDVSPEDPDFPYIQGLAEAGLIASNLSRHDSSEDGRSTDGAVFLPDSTVSRQDLVSWKLALEKHNLVPVDKQVLKAQSGYIDVDRISEDALPFLAADLAAGERSIVASAFGFTRRFQPEKPVTRGQAAIALVTGEAADAVAEEITRLEAEQMAEAAVVAEYALEARAQKQVEEYFDTELKMEREMRLSVMKQLEEVKDELEKMIQEREAEQKALEQSKASMEAERGLLMKFREAADEQLQTLTAYRVEVEIEKEMLGNLRPEVEEQKRSLSELKTELEVEKKALLLARAWAEEEAKAARAHAKILEEARKRWQDQGIDVHVDKELDEQNIPGLPFQYSGSKSSLKRFLQRAPVQDFLAKAGELKDQVLARFFQLVAVISTALSGLRHKTSDSLNRVGSKVREVQRNTVAVASRTTHDMQESTKATVAGLSASISENTKKIADGCRGEAEKLAQRFKS
ncbi:hypothetical protein R1sor_001263 [Riccia sorocarpa]|uniref:SLH domain-containing protein n=1 Tax=Riccia sorocarpa TaxID=122646 RepID=A0ABD3GX43_9MARC